MIIVMCINLITGLIDFVPAFVENGKKVETFSDVTQKANKWIVQQRDKRILNIQPVEYYMTEQYTCKLHVLHILPELEINTCMYGTFIRFIYLYVQLLLSDQ